MRQKARHALDIEIQKISIQRAVRQIGTGVVRLAVGNRVQRIQRDERRARGSQHVDRRAQIGEIAAAPVARRPQAVETQPDARHAAFDHARAPRAHDEAGVLEGLLLRLFHPVDAQVVIAQAQAGKGMRLETNSRPSNCDALQFLQLRQPEPVMLQIAVFPAEFEFHGSARRVRPECAAGIESESSADHDGGIEGARPSRQVALGSGALQLLVAVRGNPKAASVARRVSSEAMWVLPQVSVYSSSTPQPAAARSRASRSEANLQCNLP